MTPEAQAPAFEDTTIPVEPPSEAPGSQLLARSEKLGRRAADSLLTVHIQHEEQVWKDLKAWQKQLDVKIDALVTGLARNTEVCDDIRNYQIAGRVVTNVVKWVGGLAAAAAGFLGLWAAIRALTGVHPPGPQ